MSASDKSDGSPKRADAGSKSDESAPFGELEAAAASNHQPVVSKQQPGGGGCNHEPDDGEVETSPPAHRQAAVSEEAREQGRPANEASWEAVEARRGARHARVPSGEPAASRTQAVGSNLSKAAAVRNSGPAAGLSRASGPSHGHRPAARASLPAVARTGKGGASGGHVARSQQSKREPERGRRGQPSSKRLQPAAASPQRGARTQRTFGDRNSGRVSAGSIKTTASNDDDDVQRKRKGKLRRRHHHQQQNHDHEHGLERGKSSSPSASSPVVSPSQKKRNPPQSTPRSSLSASSLSLEPAISSNIKLNHLIRFASRTIKQSHNFNTSSSLIKSLTSTTTSTMADQAVVDKLEAGFAKLQAATPEQCHSLLKKYLTRPVLDNNKSKKTAMGATLLDVAQSGFENLDSGVGIYAPDAESYTLFADLFNPIIEDYHGGFKATDKHPQSDFGDMNTLVNVDPNNEFVISTRVRCGRSLQGYPFNPCLTEAQYKEMESKVSSTLKEMSGDLAGTYYPLTGMTKETQQQLIDDHFLFKEGDRFLQAANACRYWPTGRGIYHNAEKTFLVWVNEEDHLRIISMQKGGDLKTIYDRLIRGAKAIEAKVPFSRDDRLGFLTFCPTNLGTTIRASVHIKLPKLAADRKKLEEVASRYNLQVRGTSGEHTESVGGVYDISNKRRLGLTEYQAVREMQDGILELIKIEKSL